MRLRLIQSGDTPTSSAVLLINSPQHPFDVSAVSRLDTTTLIDVAIDDWNNALTPWQAPGLRREDPPFGGEARRTLEALTCELATFERQNGLAPSHHAIIGYSLGGLFALYTLLNERMYDAAASVSGSLWFDEWTSYLERQPPDLGHGRFAYLSVGTKEKRAAQPRIKLVEQRTRQTEQLLQRLGFDTELTVGPGSHFQFVQDRLNRGFAVLEEALDGMASCAGGAC